MADEVRIRPAAAVASQVLCVATVRLCAAVAAGSLANLSMLDVPTGDVRLLLVP